MTEPRRRQRQLQSTSNTEFSRLRTRFSVGNGPSQTLNPQEKRTFGGSSRATSAGATRPSARKRSGNPRASQASNSASRAHGRNTGRTTSTPRARAVKPAHNPRALKPVSYDGAAAVRPVMHSSQFHGFQKEAKQHHVIRNSVIVVILLFLLLVGAMGALAYVQVKNIKTEISAVTINVKGASSYLKSGDYDKCAAAMRSTSSSIEVIQESLNSPAITFFSYFPVVGHDINNAKIILENANVVLNDCVVPVTESLSTGASGGFITPDKTVNYSAINAVIEPIKNNSTQVSGAIATIRKACDFNIPQIAEKVDPVKDKLDSVQNIIDVVGRYAPQVQSMMGAYGDRKYLFVAQNTTEMRSTGGFPGSTGTIGFKGGKISLGTFASGKEMIEGERPASCPVTSLDSAVYPLGVKYTMDTGYDAHFPNSAKIWTATYANKKNEEVNGVISVAPSMVQSVLKVVGEVTLEDGTKLNGDNATKVLQHDIYWTYLSGDATSADNDVADALFSSAAKKSFDKLFSSLNTSTLVKLIKILPDAIDNREFMLYMVDENEQRAVEELGCSGSLSTEISQQKLGIFCGIRSACKLGWWLDKSFDVQKTGETTYHVNAVFSSALTQDELSVGGNYIMGYPRDGEIGNIFPWIYIFAPSGGTISDLQVNGRSYGSEYVEENRQLLYLEKLNLPAQGTATITFDVTMADGSSTDKLEIETNPTLTKYR